MLKLNTNRFSLTGLAAFLIIAGVVIRKNLSVIENEHRMKIGTALFTCGWALFVYSMNLGSNGINPYAILPAAAVIFSSLKIEDHIKEGSEIPSYWTILFSVAWLSIGIYIVNKRRLVGPSAIAGYFGPVLILISLLWSL